METTPRATPPKAMTIGGSDSGAGSGIQADLKTFAALGVYGTSVLTAVTAQNTVEVAAIAEVPEEVVIAQIDTVFEDIGAVAVKTGMLSGKAIVQNVADRIEAWGPRWLVVDPVLVSRGGVPLLQRDAMGAFKRDLLPHAAIVTPGVEEAQVLSGISIATVKECHGAARKISALGPRWVLILGGCLDESGADLLFDGEEFTRIDGEPIDTAAMHGIGDTYSAAITAFLALGLDMPDAVRRARRFVEAALKDSFAIGEGHAPLNPTTPAAAGILAEVMAAVRP